MQIKKVTTILRFKILSVLADLAAYNMKTLKLVVH